MEKAGRNLLIKKLRGKPRAPGKIPVSSTTAQRWGKMTRFLYGINSQRHEGTHPEGYGFSCFFLENGCMHIAEGVLSAPVLVGGAGAALAGTAVGLKAIEYDRITRVGILSSAFFVASLIHVNIGPSSTHLVLNAHPSMRPSRPLRRSPADGAR